ncbi:hypothetical protein MLD38_023759 [Melastoma candidum]|uniref:Uncharacterized protein n=1 Tax=Melastoma candidum TaxID=119954 RepID=A0ACB9NTL0_9MYRT|nr:hypothetical protein MLD38_023759 [Melastoma candidum]
MADRIIARDDLSANVTSSEAKQEEDEEEFRSCCEDDDVWTETEEGKKLEAKYVLGENSVKLFFKGVSISMNESGDSAVGLSGIGVVIERLVDLPIIQVQKKLEFYVEESVADYLALLDGLAEAIKNNASHVYAFTDSESLHSQIVRGEEVEVPLLEALRQRIQELNCDLDTFELEVVDGSELERSLQLAQVAVGVVSSPVKWDKSTHNCSICCEGKPLPMMITMKCSHKFCSHCMRTYVDGKVQSNQVPIRCPQPRCKYYVSLAESRHFLPHTSYESLEKALAEADVQSHKIYCPYSNCSALLYPHECLSSRASTSSQSESNCVECPACQRFICVECGVPWHASFTCEEYQNLPLEERDAADITLHRLAANNRWKRCQQCRRMIELTQGCRHMTCLCGHEFCYSCGAEYRDGQQTCHCAFWDEDRPEDLISYSAQESEQWAWETFNSLPMVTDAYSEQERSQLMLIQRFLAGGFSLSDHCPSYQHTSSSPPRCSDSYTDAMKDLNQLPWLQRFVSVISDDYYEELLQ